MELALQRVERDLIHIAVAGVCRDAADDVRDAPLGQIPLESWSRYTILVNMRDIALLNSNGIGWLLVCHKRCREAGGRWIVHSLPPAAMQVLRLMRLHDVLELAADERQAILFAKDSAA